MFWQSVLLGIQGFSDWHIWVGILGILLTVMLWRLISGLVVGDGESGIRGAVGCVMSLAEIAVQALAVSLFVLFCLPSLLSGSGFTPAAVISEALVPVLQSCFVALGLICLLSFIPIVGGMISGTPGVPIFLQGILVFGPLTRYLYEVGTHGKKIPVEAFPNFWLSLGYIGIGVVIVHVFLFIVAWIVDRSRRSELGFDSGPSPLVLLVGALIGPVVGILPLLMYSKYVALYLKGPL